MSRLPDSDEREILEKLTAGDPEALRVLYEEHAEGLARLVVGPRVRDPEAARDLVQETFLAAADRGRDFRWKGVGFFYWLRGIALNLVRRHSRR